jgi:hypothetical protein
LTPESFVLAVNAVILLAAYFWVYPRFAGADLHRLSRNDLAANLCALVVVGYSFYGTDTVFTLLSLPLGWFGYTVITFLMMELPFFFWYARRYGLFKTSGSDDER